MILYKCYHLDCTISQLTTFVSTLSVKCIHVDIRGSSSFSSPVSHIPLNFNIPHRFCSSSRDGDLSCIKPLLFTSCAVVSPHTHHSSLSAHDNVTVVYLPIWVGAFNGKPPSEPQTKPRAQSLGPMRQVPPLTAFPTSWFLSPSSRCSYGSSQVWLQYAV